jgi:CubicO group peptidase (beta-lactamase class C family)
MGRRCIPLVVWILCWPPFAVRAAPGSAAPSSQEPATKNSGQLPKEDSQARDAERLRKELVAATPEEWQNKLDSLANHKGMVFTRALVQAIGELDGRRRQQARDALALRLARMKADTLRDYLADNDPELRRAAALACVIKQDRSLLPDLQKLQSDPDTFVARAAKTAHALLAKEPDGPKPFKEVARPRPSARPEAAPGTLPKSAPVPPALSAHSLDELLESLRQKYDLPALAAAVIYDGQVTGVSAVGVRRYGSSVQVTPDDRFSIGSCGKAMTATLLGTLVEHSKLRWETTLGKVLPAAVTEGMQPAYRTVTLEQILSHRGGLQAFTRPTPESQAAVGLIMLSGTVSEQRLAFARYFLRQPAVGKPGERFVYSNVGYVLAGLMAEQVTHQTWEELMQTRIFKPLGMKTSGFGPAASPGTLDQPWFHKVEGDKHLYIEPGLTSDNPPLLGPAGRIHCSLGDWAKFAVAHLRGARGQDGLLRAGTFHKLHTPSAGGNYAFGWMVRTPEWSKTPVLTHGGSNGSNFAEIWIAPAQNCAVLVATNQGGDQAQQACAETAQLLIRRCLDQSR